jgi:hypothetical protein
MLGKGVRFSPLALMEGTDRWFYPCFGTAVGVSASGVQLLYLPCNAESSKGRTADFESANLGSNPSSAICYNINRSHLWHKEKG